MTLILHPHRKKKKTGHLGIGRLVFCCMLFFVVFLFVFLVNQFGRNQQGTMDLATVIGGGVRGKGGGGRGRKGGRRGREGGRGGGGGEGPRNLIKQQSTWGGGGGGGYILLQPQQPQPYKSMEIMVILPALQFLLRPCYVIAVSATQLA